jgi:endoglucanase
MHSVTPGRPPRRRRTGWTPISRAATFAAAAAAAVVIAPAAASARSPHSAGTGGHGIAANTRFYVPAPASGAIEQIGGLLRSRDARDAALLAKMELVPSAVWLDGETQAQAAEGAAGVQQADDDVARQVREALIGSSLERAVPVFVAYNIPGRDCSQYSAGGAPSDAAYDAWINALRGALGDARAVVILEPDALANLPGYCGSAYQANFPDITNTTRIGDVAYGVQTLETDPNISVYLDAGNSAWQTVGNISEVLMAADVQQAQGFFLNVSNYQYATNSDLYGEWVSSCIAYATQLGGENQASASGYASGLTSADNNPSGAFGACPNQYWNGGPANNWTGTAMNRYGIWSESASDPALNSAGIDSRFASMLGSVVPTTHFVVDTSRDGQGPNDMSAYAAAPYDQPASVISTLQSGNWCNPPGSGLGTRPTADTGAITNALDSYLPADSPLLDAYLWVKTPGQSDGQCDIAGGVRGWQDYTSAGAGGGDTPAIAGWPTSSSSTWTTFDPLWSTQTGTLVTDPAAGAWFPQQALQLAQDANPRLTR